MNNAETGIVVRLDPSKGGKARAESLTPEERSEIARHAAESRWQSDLPKAVYTGELKIGDIILPCAVLEDGTRVLTRAGFLQAIGRTGGAKGGRKYDDEFKTPVFLTAQNLKPFLSSELIDNSSPIVFRPERRGRMALGYRAELLPQVCNVFLDAHDAGALSLKQLHIVEKCKILLRGFATVGIIALVDEATGYQEVRARNALTEILEKFVAKELRPWMRTFPNEFYREMFRLQGWEYSQDFGSSRPRMAGLLTDDIIYKRLAPGVREELRRLIPRNDKGRLKYHLHRRLTEEIGHPKLREHLAVVVTLMQLADSWEAFIYSLDRVRPRFGATMLLPFKERRIAQAEIATH